MIRELDRYPVGLCKTRGCDGIGSNLAFHHFHLTLHFADSREVFVEFAPVGRPKTTLQAAGVIRDKIENALLIPGGTSAGSGISGALVGAEKAFEDRTWIHFGRVRNGRSAPGDAIHISAAIAGIAIPREMSVFTAKLQRGQARCRTDLLCRELVNRDTNQDI